MSARTAERIEEDAEDWDDPPGPWIVNGHELNDDAVCACGFDAAEHAWLNLNAYREDRRPVPPCERRKT